MSFIRKLFGLKEKTVPDDTPARVDKVYCPNCGSQKVTLQFSDNKKTQPSVQSGRCARIESGSTKKICQECAHEWDETDIDADSTVYLMMK